jgi:hypothetical protein
MNFKKTNMSFSPTLFSLASIIVISNLSITSPVSAARLDGCDPSAKENQAILGADWKSKCLNASVNSVWEEICDKMTLGEAKKSSSQNGCWKLISQERFSKQKK